MPNFKTQHITDWTRNELETLAENHQLIDVRTAEEYELGHVQGALLHPVQQIETFDLPTIVRIIFIVVVAAVVIMQLKY